MDTDMQDLTCGSVQQKYMQPLAILIPSWLMGRSLLGTLGGTSASMAVNSRPGHNGSSIMIAKLPSFPGNIIISSLRTQISSGVLHLYILQRKLLEGYENHRFMELITSCRLERLSRALCPNCSPTAPKRSCAWRLGFPDGCSGTCNIRRVLEGSVQL